MLARLVTGNNERWGRGVGKQCRPALILWRQPQIKAPPPLQTDTAGGIFDAGSFQTEAQPGVTPALRLQEVFDFWPLSASSFLWGLFGSSLGVSGGWGVGSVALSDPVWGVTLSSRTTPLSPASRRTAGRVRLPLLFIHQRNEWGSSRTCATSNENSEACSPLC